MSLSDQIDTEIEDPKIEAYKEAHISRHAKLAKNPHFKTMINLCMNIDTTASLQTNLKTCLH